MAGAVFFAGAAPVELDSQGRFLIPQSLREYAGIDREVVIVGVLDRAEIWDKKRFTDKNTYSDDEMDEVAIILSYSERRSSVWISNRQAYM